MPTYQTKKEKKSSQNSGTVQVNLGIKDPRGQWAEDAKRAKATTTYVESKEDHQRMLDEGNRKAKNSGAYYQKKQEAAAQAKETGRKGWRGSISSTPKGSNEMTREAFSDEYRREAERQNAAQRTKEHSKEAEEARRRASQRRGG